MPAYDLVDLDFYTEYMGVSVMFSRGCPFKCTFCASHTVHGRVQNHKNIDQFINEVKFLLDQRAKVIHIEDRKKENS